MTCEHCQQNEPFVRIRRRYNEPDVVLCAPCWLDLQLVTQKERQEP